MSSSARRELENYIKNLHIKAEAVLDVGGSQNPIKKRLGKFEAKTYMIADLTMPHHVEHKPDIHIDLNRKSQINAGFKGKFDVAFCFEVMEYIWDPVQALDNISYFLPKGGVLYISFTFSYPIHPPHGQDMLRYTHYGAIKLLNESGFEVEDLVFRQAADPNHYMEWCNNEGFRYDRGISFGEMTATGVIIKAIKK